MASIFMKKKIKDLTFEDVIKVCKKHGTGLTCEDCPLLIIYSSDFKICCLEVLRKLDVEKEVEVDESHTR